MGKFSAAQFDEWIKGYEQDKAQVLEKIGRLDRVLKITEGANDPYRAATVDLRDRLGHDAALYDQLIAHYKAWKAEP